MDFAYEIRLFAVPGPGPRDTRSSHTSSVVYILNCGRHNRAGWSWYYMISSSHEDAVTGLRTRNSELPGQAPASSYK